MTDPQQPAPLASRPEPITKISNLADACLEVHKSSSDPKDARKAFMQLLQQAYLLGTGKELDPKMIPRPGVSAATSQSASTFKPRTPAPAAPAKAAKPADPKKVSHDTGKGAPAQGKGKGKDAPAKAPAAPVESKEAANDALETF